MLPAILVVEDDDICADTLGLALRSVGGSLGGTKVLTVGNAYEALRLLNPPGAVCALIVDLQLPGLDGFSLIENIRSQPGARLPIVVVSGYSEPGTEARVTRLGADAFFEKPYSPAEVRRAVERLLYTH